MIIPKWLLPVIALVAAVAVAAAAALLGMRFATPDIQSSPTQTRTVPIAAPIQTAVGSEELSRTIGQLTVTNPGSVQSPVPPEQQAIIEDVAHSEDPGARIQEIADAAAGSPADTDPAPGSTAPPADDPCSPSSGTPADDCPDAIHGAIFADEILRPMWVAAVAYAPPPRTVPHNVMPSCPADAAIAVGQVPLGVITPTPSDFTITYWPIGDPSDNTVVTYSTSADARTAYANSVAAHVNTWDRPLSRGCPALAADPNTSYIGQVTATDDMGRSAGPQQIQFNGGGAAVHPELQLNYSGDNTLFASALHAPNETVLIEAVMGSEATQAHCDSDQVFFAYRPPTEDTVSSGYLADHRILPQNTQRTTAVFIIPEGAEFVVCARWFAGTHVPDWAVSHPLYQSMGWVASPDLLLPTISLVDVLEPSQMTSVRFSGATAGGYECGSPVDFQLVSGHRNLTFPVPLCAASAQGLVQSDGSRIWWSASTRYTGVVISTEGSLRSGGSVSNSIAVIAPALPCDAGCVVPDPVRYSMEIAPGDPVAGRATFEVTYDQGNRSGHSGWTFGSVMGSTPDYVRPDRPSLDLNAQVTLLAPDVASRTVRATLPITSDRPVDYTVRLYDASGSALCLRPGDPFRNRPDGSATITGHLDVPGVVTIPGLCLGETYGVEVELRDADGHRSIWGARGTDPQGWWPVNSVFNTPGLTGTIHYNLIIQDYENVEFTTLDVNVGTQEVADSTAPGMNVCDGDGIINPRGSVQADRGLSETTVLHLRYWVYQGEYGSGSNCGRLSHGHLVDVTLPVTLEQLTSLDGVVMSNITTELYSLHVWFDPEH